MKILLVSDSHGNMRALKSVIQANPDAKYVLHAGDGVRDCRRLDTDGRYQLYYVKGNCDMEEDVPLEEIVQIGRIRILLVHGHQFAVKHDVYELVSRAKELNVDLTVFGHTHRPVIENKRGALIINPGTVNYSRSYGMATYAVVEIEDDDIVSAKIMPVDL